MGHLVIRDAAAEALDAAGARTQGGWARLSLGLSRTTLLPRGFTLATSARAQAALSSRNLDGSERMSVTGPAGVQAYLQGELAGDHAALVRVELAPLPVGGDVQWPASAFTDYGWARAVHAQGGGIGASRTLGNIGLGLTWSCRKAALPRCSWRTAPAARLPTFK